MKQKQIGFEVNHNEVYRCNKCGGAAWRVVWLSTGDVQLQWNGSLYIVQRVMNSDDKSTSKGGGYSPSFFLLIYIYIISHTAKVDKYNPRLKRG